MNSNISHVLRPLQMNLPMFQAQLSTSGPLGAWYNLQKATQLAGIMQDDTSLTRAHPGAAADHQLTPLSEAYANVNSFVQCILLGNPILHKYAIYLGLITKHITEISQSDIAFLFGDGTTARERLSLMFEKLRVSENT